MLKIPWHIVLHILDTVGARCYLMFPRSMVVSRANLHLSLVLPNFFPENKQKTTKKEIKTLEGGGGYCSRYSRHHLCRWSLGIGVGWWFST